MRNTCTIELKHHIYDNCFFRKSRDAKTGTMSIQVYRIGETGYADPLLTVTENLGPQAPRHVQRDISLSPSARSTRKS